MGQRPPSGQQPYISPAYLAKIMREEYYGPENAAPNGVIARRLGMTDHGTNGRHGIRSSRTFTDAVERAQKCGYPITRNSDGYFYARCDTDVDFEIHDLMSRIATWNRKLEAARTARAAAGATNRLF